MALSSDLMGIGFPPLQAETIASGGNGPVTVNKTGTVNIFGNQRLIYLTGVSTANPVLPPIGGDNGALIGDPFYIVNSSTTSGTLSASGSATITGTTSLAASTLYIAIPVTTTIWAVK